MPPRVVKRGAAAVGQRKVPRATKGALKAPNPEPDVSEEVEKEVADPPAEAREIEEDGVVEDLKIEEKPIVEEKVAVEEKEVLEEEEEDAAANLDLNRTAHTDKEDGMKEHVEEYEKDERLELDDNDPEFEHEEYVGADYDEKEIDREGMGEEVEEEPDVEQRDGELSEGEGVPEAEGVDDDEHAAEETEHADFADATEHEERNEVVQERRKRKEFEVFVGGLDKDANEDDLRKVFSKVGEIVEVRLLMNPQTKKNKGFAFLRFAAVEQAKRALTELKNPVINGKQCGVTPCQDSDTLFLGNICKTWTKEALKEKLKHYGVEDVEDITLVEDTNNPGKNRGFAFLEFSSRLEAMDASKLLQRRDVLFGVDRPAKVSFADSFIDPGDEIMAHVKTIFIDCLSPSWDEDHVRELLKKYGEIEKVELARNMPSADRKDYGFVTFDTHDAAVTCAKSINNTEMVEGDHKAKVRARLSRPHQRGWVKHAGRDNFRSGNGARPVRGSWTRAAPRSYPSRPVRGIGSRVPPPITKRPIGLRDNGFRDRRHIMSAPTRSRPLAPPPRSYNRRAPVSSYPKSSSSRDYGRHDELLPPPRSRAPADYGFRPVPERRPSYSDEYSSRNSAYSDLPRSTSRAVARRPYVDDGYGQRFERPPPSFREGRERNYDSVSGSKRQYSAMIQEDIPPRYSEMSGRHSRARLDYEPAGPPPQYGDAYGDRVGRSSSGYGGSRSSASSQDSRGFYGGRHGMGHGEGSFAGGDGGRVYSSSGHGGDYIPRGSNGGGSAPSSLYSSRSTSRSSYMGGGGSGSYY